MDREEYETRTGGLCALLNYHIPGETGGGGMVL